MSANTSTDQSRTDTDKRSLQQISLHFDGRARAQFERLAEGPAARTAEPYATRLIVRTEAEAAALLSEFTEPKLLRYEPQLIQTCQRVRHDLIEALEKRGYRVENGDLEERDLLADGGMSNTLEPIAETHPATPADLETAEVGADLYIEYREPDRSGIPAIRGTITSVTETDAPDHVATLHIDGNQDGTQGVFDVVLWRDGEEIVLDPAIEADTDARGYHAIELATVETLEIHNTAADGGLPTCTQCDQPYTVTVTVGPGETRRSCGCRVATDGGGVCTTKQCTGEARFAYWMPDCEQFSRARAPEDPQLADGDLAPYVCEACRDRLGNSAHYEADRFIRPEEKLVADGGEVTVGMLERDPTTTVYLAGHNGAKKQRLHTEADCTHLTAGKTRRERTLDSVRNDWKVCKRCLGVAETGGVDGDPNETRRDLLDTNPEDLGLSPLGEGDLSTDGGHVPQSFESLASTCESCGGDVEPRYLEDGECPGCVYGGER